MSRYRKVEVRTWGDAKFRQLSPIPPCGQGLWLFLITGPHTGPIPGLFRAGPASMAEELGWSKEGFDKAFDEAFRLGMVKADFKSRVVWVPNAIKHNKPESPNVVKSWGTEFDLIPECPLKFEAYEGIKAFIYSLGESFKKAFDDTFEKPSGKPSPKTMPNQEQEQEQENKTAAKPPVRRRVPRETDPSWLLDFKLVYPNRDGDQKWRSAIKAANERIREGHTPEQFIEGAKRYAAWCEAKQLVGTDRVKQAATFLGPDKPFLETWNIPPPKGSPPANWRDDPRFKGVVQ